VRTRGHVLAGAFALAFGVAAAWWTSASPPGRPPEAPAPPEAGAAPRALVETPAVSRGAHDRAGTEVARAPAAVEPAGPLERDPRGRGYDAARLFNLHIGDARGIFDAEPRVEAWARQREADIVAAALSELQRADPDVRMEVECRTGTCRVRVHSRNTYLTDQMDFYPLVCLASFAQPEWGNSTSDDPSVEDPYSDFYLIFGAATRGADGFAAQRDSTCGQYRDAWRRKAEQR
jgi:hypothetical protein